MSTNDPNRARMIPTFSRPQSGAPVPIFQPGPGAHARERGAHPNTAYNTSGPVNLQAGPVDYGGQHAALGRYRPPMFDLQGNPDPRDLGGYAYNLPNQYGPYPLNQYAGRFMAQDIYHNRGLENMLTNRQGGVSLVDVLRQGIIRMLTSGPQAAFTTPANPQAAPTSAQAPVESGSQYGAGTADTEGTGIPTPVFPDLMYGRGYVTR